MAKLHSYYVLCPLIDQKSFLGVSLDREPQNVIVTLGRNVVNIYRLSDQKQIGGWTSKDHITSAIVYDQEHDGYIGVFNNNTIKTWKDGAISLDKQKKYKFPQTILKLLPRGDQSSIIVFANGNCVSLSYGLENHKTISGKSILKNNDSIIDVASYNSNNIDYISYITKNDQDKYEIIYCPLRNELGDLEKAKLVRVKVSREDNDVYVVGQLISTKENPVIYILWNDGKMTQYDLLTATWKTIGSVPWISTFSNVSMAWMGQKHLILFGSNIEQDGAIIVAYNTSLGVGSCRYPMKMFTENSKLYCYDNRIILEASNHIGMLPYVVESSRSLSSLLGSHEVIQDEQSEAADWGMTDSITIECDKETKECLALGVTERTACSQIIQKYLEKNDHSQIFKILKQFNDIPETVLVQCLLYILNSINIENFNIHDKKVFAEQISVNKNKSLQKKLQFLHYIFQISFCDVLVVPHLRDGLTLDHALFLLTYICHLLVGPDTQFDLEFESRLYDWCNLLMDSFYQQYVMSKDENVARVMDNTLEIIKELVENLTVMDEALPLLNKLVWTKNIHEHEETLPYTIELMQL